MNQIILTMELIQGVVRGEETAQRLILQYYDQYLNSLVTTVTEDENGNKYYQLDEDLKVQIQYKYLEAIKKWKAIKK
ncbi:MAG: helix-turn-helix domain-containing protein [Eubacteriales bacterium]|nr:helix-turn-helix domain-containing protein [Eubacteriales bacterium]